MTALPLHAFSPTEDFSHEATLKDRWYMRNMRIFAYINRNFPDAVEIHYCEGQNALSFVGAGEKTNKTLRTIIRNLLGFAPSGLVQASKPSNLQPLVFAIALAIKAHAVTINELSVLVAGTSDLSGNLTSATPPYQYQEVARRYRCALVLLPPNIGDQWPSVRHVSTLNQALRSLLTYHPSFDGNAHPLSSIIGLSLVKRAVEIATAGRFHLFLYGPPGCGKTMVFSRLCHYQETMPEFWIRGHMSGKYLEDHQITSLVDGGVLIADELPCQKSSALLFLRTLMDNSESIMVAGAMNTCPCGAKGLSGATCTCSEKQINAYWDKVGIPLLDRFDIRLQVGDDNPLQSHIEVLPNDWKDRILWCRKQRDIHTNGEYLSILREATRCCDLSKLSTRSRFSFARISRTIADYDGVETVGKRQFLEAYGYKRFRNE